MGYLNPGCFLSMAIFDKTKCQGQFSVNQICVWTFLIGPNIKDLLAWSMSPGMFLKDLLACTKYLCGRFGPDKMCANPYNNALQGL